MQALRVKNTKAEGVGHAHNKTDGSGWVVDSIGTTFTTDLENTTSEDITLPESVRVMETNKETGALHESSLKLKKDYFIPTHQTVSIEIENAGECTEDIKTDACFDSVFKGISGIVLFDQGPKREVRIIVRPLRAQRTEFQNISALPKSVDDRSVYAGNGGHLVCNEMSNTRRKARRLTAVSLWGELWGPQR